MQKSNNKNNSYLNTDFWKAILSGSNNPPEGIIVCDFYYYIRWYKGEKSTFYENRRLVIRNNIEGGGGYSISLYLTNDHCLMPQKQMRIKKVGGNVVSFIGVGRDKENNLPFAGYKVSITLENNAIVCANVEIDETNVCLEHFIANEVESNKLKGSNSNVSVHKENDYNVDSKPVRMSEDSDLESIVNTIHKCVEKTKEIKDYAMKEMEFIDDSIKKASREIEKCIHEIQVQNINDTEITQSLINELSKRKDEFSQMNYMVKKKLNEKVKYSEEFNIVLFGKTKVGKSTLMEILTNGDGSTIGKGGQRTTTDIRKYKWKGLTITDVPGIEAFQGQDDEEKAFAAAETADIVLFMISNGQPEATEADWLVNLKKIDKPIICLCNVRGALSNDMEMEIFLDRQKEILEDVRIEEVIAQFNEFVQSKLPKEYIDISVTQLQARYLANKITDKQKRTSLINASRFTDVEDKIIEMVKRNGVSFRQKCFLSIIDAPLYTQCIGMFQLNAVTSHSYMIVNDKVKEFCNWKDDFLVNEKPLLKSKIDNIFDEAVTSIPSFVEDNSERDNFNAQLSKHIKKLRIDNQVQNIFNSCEDKVVMKIKQLFNDLNTDLRLVPYYDRRYTGKTKIHSMGASVTNWKRGFQWVSDISGALSFIPVVAPVAIGVSLVSRFISWLSVSREDKLKEENKKIVEDVCRQLNMIREEKIKNVFNEFNDRIFSVLNEAYNRLNIISTTLLALSNSQRELALAYLRHHSDISKRMIQCVLSNLVRDSAVSHRIDFVARVPGKRTIIGSTDDCIRRVSPESISEKIGNCEDVIIFGESLSDHVELNFKLLRDCLHLPYSMKLRSVSDDGINWEVVVPKYLSLNDEDETSLHLLQQILNIRIVNIEQIINDHFINR